MCVFKLPLDNDQKLHPGWSHRCLLQYKWLMKNVLKICTYIATWGTLLSSRYSQLKPCIRTSLLILTFGGERDLPRDCFCDLTRGMRCCRVRKRVTGDPRLRQCLLKPCGWIVPFSMLKLASDYKLYVRYLGSNFDVHAILTKKSFYRWQKEGVELFV